jgi:hypothetical protein
MGRSFSRRERAAGSRFPADDLRTWIEDWVGVSRSHRFEECTAALRDAGFLLPPSDGWGRLRQVFDKAQVQVLDNWRFGQRGAAELAAGPDAVRIQALAYGAGVMGDEGGRFPLRPARGTMASSRGPSRPTNWRPAAPAATRETAS